jgi:hypothetical protein
VCLLPGHRECRGQRQLVPENKNLELLRPVTPSQEDDQLQEPAHNGIQQRHKQRRPPGKRGRQRYSGIIPARVNDRVSAPHGDQPCSLGDEPVSDSAHGRSYRTDDDGGCQGRRHHDDSKK